MMINAAANVIKSASDVLVVSHYDADGLTSGAIASLTLDRLGIHNDVVSVKRLDKGILGGLPDHELYWFVDIGSGQIDLIDSTINNYVISDHHEVLDYKGGGIEVNASRLGFDGAREISGAGVTYLISKAISEENKDLSAIAIVGAVGDMQDSTGSLVGKNREILQDGIEAGVLCAKKDLRFFGRHTRPLTQFLSYSMYPIFPGLTGNEPGCSRFLASLGIPLKSDTGWRRYVDLSELEKKRLVDGLVEYGLDSGLTEDVLISMIGEVYELSREPEGSYTRDAKEFSTLLNACGRHDKTELGIAVAKGDRGKAYNMAMTVLKRHRAALHDAIKWVITDGIDDRGKFYLIDGRNVIDEGIIGIVCGMIYNTGYVSLEKPIIGLATGEDGNVKVSARANWKLVNKGLNLGEILRRASEKLGGIGGGHNIAAGATIPRDSIEAFISELDRAFS